jgi:hypothetical protein
VLEGTDVVQNVNAANSITVRDAEKKKENSFIGSISNRSHFFDLLEWQSSTLLRLLMLY